MGYELVVLQKQKLADVYMNDGENESPSTTQYYSQIIAKHLATDSSKKTLLSVVDTPQWLRMLKMFNWIYLHMLGVLTKEVLTQHFHF